MENRPTIRDLKDSDISQIAKEVFEESKANFEDCNISEADIFMSIKYIGYKNGYEYAKHLEENYSAFDIDSIIIDALDCIDFALYQAKNVKEKEWVSKNNITPLFKVGDIVNHKRGTNSIYEIDYEYAKYKINTDKGNAKDIVNFEDVIEDNHV